MGPAATNDFFRITVVDQETGRGVPLIELRTVNHISCWTDNAGVIAFLEPGLMGEDVYFHVGGHGYEHPADGFGNRGVKLNPVAGGAAVIRVRRLNVAERLYRVTGQGLYRDSLLVNAPVPLRQPALNGQVMGQDTVVATPYRGRLYWFWGDTERVSYPLGQFGVSGATSELPGRGGLDPAVGIDLRYFVDASGFSKPMCPDFGPGLHWIEGVMTLPDDTGRERLVARVASQKELGPAHAWHLAVFNDEKEVFESRVRWDLRESHDSSHPFRAVVDGVEYFYLYPNYRVRAEWRRLADLGSYEAFTCVAGAGRLAGRDTRLDRDATGRPLYAWKAGADRLHPGRVRELIDAGVLRPEESWLHLHDVTTGRPVPAGRGSVCWNDFRRRWVMLVSSAAGEVWFSEADTPTGPWLFARRVVAHDDYNFYNPTQHPFFDQEGGRLIYFEGTYTASFSRAKARTPRYDYNQILYRLALDDPRLALPAPVYQMREAGSGGRYQMREDIELTGAWTNIERVAFCAMPRGRAPAGSVPLFIGQEQGATILQTRPPSPEAVPLCYVLPAGADTNVAFPAPSSLVVDLIEARAADGRRVYGIEDTATTGPAAAGRKVLGRVWRNPSRVLTLDHAVRPKAP
ncbi:MAG TPA: hypothetical protein VNO52_12875 [Methylomirabilota bacterium]|nr:hypothetical protein [Methylomirabilota bacterium]